MFRYGLASLLLTLAVDLLVVRGFGLL